MRVNRIVSHTFVLILGGAAGVFVGMKLAEKKADEKYEKIIQEEITSIRERLGQKKKQLMENVEGMDEEISASVQTKEKNRPIALKEYEKKMKEMGYDKLDNEKDPDFYKYQEMSRDSIARSRMEPHVITYEEFNETMEEYDKVSINFYEDDEILTDENDEVIPYPVDVIGSEALNMFGEGSEDPEIVYVRNDKMGTDYEIARLSKSYAETVLGYTDSTERGEDR
jgi:gas vesicle protein